MLVETKLRKIGNSLGVVLPKAALEQLNVQAGDLLAIMDAPGGGLLITPSKPGQAQFAQQMKAAESVVRRYRNTLRKLAKH